MTVDNNMANRETTLTLKGPAVQARRLCIQSPDASAPAGGAPHAEQSGRAGLGQAQADLVRTADTFFIATHHEADSDDPVGIKSGNDISHRGGPPGFVRLDGPDRLRWPDYIGNNFFQSLGEARYSSMPSTVLLQGFSPSGICSRKCSLQTREEKTHLLLPAS